MASGKLLKCTKQPFLYLFQGETIPFIPCSKVSEVLAKCYLLFLFFLLLLLLTHSPSRMCYKAQQACSAGGHSEEHLDRLLQVITSSIMGYGLCERLAIIGE